MDMKLALTADPRTPLRDSPPDYGRPVGLGRRKDEVDAARARVGRNAEDDERFVEGLGCIICSPSILRNVWLWSFLSSIFVHTRGRNHSLQERVTMPTEAHDSNTRGCDNAGTYMPSAEADDVREEAREGGGGGARKR